MKTFPNDAKKISIVFICDLCQEETPVEAFEVPAEGEKVIRAICPVCFKEFDVKVIRRDGKSWVEIEDVEEDEITITVE